MTKLRGYQQQLQAGIFDAWGRGAKCVIGVTATGSGKTVTMADTARKLAEAGSFGIVQAHRAELVGQLSLALAREGLRHNITAAKNTVKAIVNAHIDETGRSYFDPRASWEVASVDTIMRRDHPWKRKDLYLFTDEGHHVLAENKWGRGISMFERARCLLMTATPTRADGKGLGVHHDGLADAMVLGPGLGELIGWGYLTPYRVFESRVEDLDMSDVHVTASGDYNQQETARAVKRSKKIVGDAVRIYNEVTPGKLAIVFAVDIENASTITDAFNAAGVPAALVTSDTEEAERRAIMKRFKARELRVLVNVDLFGEGVDVPAVEVVIMARPTASFSLYAQQIGRMLRLWISEILMAAWDTFTVEQRHAHIAASAKPYGVLIDLVGNVRNKWKIGDGEYGPLLPEAFAAWTLDRRGRRRSSAGDGIPLRMCTGCFQPYERIYDSCPYCGVAAPPPSGRSTPEQVDGNIYELEPEFLQQLREQIASIKHPPRLPDAAGITARKGQIESQKQQFLMEQAIDQWAGFYRKDDRATTARRFFHTFGIDVLSAMGLRAAESEKLQQRILAKMQEMAVQ